MVLGYQPENMGKHANISTVMHRASSGRRYHITGMRHSYGHTSHHSLSPEFVGFAGDPSAGVHFVLPSCLLKVATQYPGSSSPVSLPLRYSSTGVMLMWMASLSNSSLGCLAMSTTVFSSHLMVSKRGAFPCFQAGNQEPCAYVLRPAKKPPLQMYDILTLIDSVVPILR